MKKFIISPIHYCAFSGILSGIITSGFTTYEGFISLRREGFDIRFVILFIITYFVLTSLFYCLTLGGLGSISGYIIRKKIWFGWKLLFLILLSICSGFVGFFSIDEAFRFDKNNIPRFSTIYYMSIFFVTFLFLQIPSYIKFRAEIPNAGKPTP